MQFDWNTVFDALTSDEFGRGALLTITLAVAAQVAATVLGFVLALMRVGSFMPARASSGVDGWIVRALPTPLLLLMIRNALPQLIPALTQDWFTPFLADFIGLALAEAAGQRPWTSVPGPALPASVAPSPACWQASRRASSSACSRTTCVGSEQSASPSSPGWSSASSSSCSSPDGPDGAFVGATDA